VGWYGALILAAKGYPLLAPSILLPIILWIVGSSPEPYKRGLFALLFIIMGFFVETTLSSLGVVSYASPFNFISGAAPLWTLGLWGIIGATFDDILQWVKGSHYLALAIVGAIGAPIVFYTGSLIGALDYPRGLLIALLVVGAIWAAILPAFAKLRKLL